MKKVFLKTISLALACILLLSVCACSGGEQNSATPAPDGQQAQASAEPTPGPTSESTPKLTAEPTPTRQPQSYWVPVDEQLIEWAFPLIETVGAVHNKHYSPEHASVQGYMEYDISYGYRLLLYIGFASEEPAQGLKLLCRPDNEGNYSFNMKDLTMMGTTIESEQAWIATYPEDVWTAYQQSLKETRFIITPEDIAEAGCTATEGEEYLLAVGRCWQQKYAEYFTSLPENYPGYCYEMRPLDCMVDHYNADQNTVQFVAGFASRPADLQAISFNYFEGDWGANFADESYPPEIYGWLVTYGGTMLQKQADGSWVGTTSCHTFG